VLGEQMHNLLDEVPEWVPVHGVAHSDVDRVELESVAAWLELPEVRWPDPFPFDSRTAMLAATFAKQAGRTVAFSLAAMRQAFAAGRDLGEADNVLIAAAACELHPRAVLTGIETASVAEALAAATRDARRRGVSEVPCAVVDGRPMGWRALLR
jgi:2-hydroxychromene-2-carboxylate isomerase